MDYSFDCSTCGAMCCLNTPRLLSVKEISYARKLGLKLVAILEKPNSYKVLIDRDGLPYCPLLDVENNNTCKIHGSHKFLACTMLDCSIVKEYASLEELVDTVLYNSMLNKLNMSKRNLYATKNKDLQTLTKKIIKQFSIPIVSAEQGLLASNMTNVEDIQTRLQQCFYTETSKK